jgi:hypothetical protein
MRARHLICSLWFANRRSVVARSCHRSSQQWCQHFLQAGDQVVGLAGTLGQVFDLIVFGADLAAEKFILPFEACDIAQHELVVSRDLSRLVATSRWLSWLLRNPWLRIPTMSLGHSEIMSLAVPT